MYSSNFFEVQILCLFCYRCLTSLLPSSSREWQLLKKKPQHLFCLYFTLNAKHPVNVSFLRSKWVLQALRYKGKPIHSYQCAYTAGRVSSAVRSEFLVPWSSRLRDQGDTICHLFLCMAVTRMHNLPHGWDGNLRPLAVGCITITSLL